MIGDNALPNRTATRGLATVALLKVNFDAGNDHVGMFEPFVLDSAATLEDGFSVDDVQTSLAMRHGLTIPANTLKTLLSRVCRKRLLTREGGRYFRTDELPAYDLSCSRAEVERRQKLLAERLRQFAAARSLEVPDDEAALSLVLDFIERFHVPLALNEHDQINPGSLGKLEEATDALDKVAARFLYEMIVEDGAERRIIEELLQGFILQNTLLLRDISETSRRFDNVRVALDSGFLWHVLGLNGAPAKKAALELLKLLTETGAVLDVYQATIREMQGILSVLEEKTATHEGRLSLHPTPLTRHILTERLSPSDIRMHSSLLEGNLKAAGLNIRDFPARRAHLTLDETELSRRLARQPNDLNEPRVVHDVNCIAAVLTTRNGSMTDSWDHCRAVFATTSALTVSNATKWYRDQGGRGVPPLIHYLALSNLAWLKRPASAAQLKLHELVALCVAALRPSPKTWESFVRELRKLELAEAISSDEVTAILASGLTDNALADAELEDDVDATSIGEIISRVKASYHETTQEQLAEAQKGVDAALRLAEEARQHATSLHGRISTLAQLTAAGASWIIVLALGGVLLSGTALGILDTRDSSKPGLLSIILFAVPLASIGLLSLISGFHLKGWRKSLERRISAALTRWWIG